MSPKSESITRTLLARAHSPDTAKRIFSEKIQHRPLHLGPSSPPPSNAREARRRAREREKEKKKPRPKPLSARERRRRGLYDVPRKGQKYEVFEPLNKLWLGYIREVLGGDVYSGSQNAASKLSSADFHGAEVEVSRSACVSRVGVRGIVIKDLRNVFEIITEKNCVKVIPKEGTVFKISIPVGDQKDGAADSDGQSLFVFEIHGDQFLHRAPDRANKKFKTHFVKNL